MNSSLKDFIQTQTKEREKNICIPFSCFFALRILTWIVFHSVFDAPPSLKYWMQTQTKQIRVPFAVPNAFVLCWYLPLYSFTHFSFQLESHVCLQAMKNWMQTHNRTNRPLVYFSDFLTTCCFPINTVFSFCNLQKFQSWNSVNSFLKDLIQAQTRTEIHWRTFLVYRTHLFSFHSEFD